MPEHVTNVKGAIDNGMLPLFRNRHSSETEKGNYICSMRKRLRKGELKENTQTEVTRTLASLRSSEEVNEAGVCESRKNHSKAGQTAVSKGNTRFSAPSILNKE